MSAERHIARVWFGGMGRHKRVLNWLSAHPAVDKPGVRIRYSDDGGGWGEVEFSTKPEADLVQAEWGTDNTVPRADRREWHLSGMAQAHAEKVY